MLHCVNDQMTAICAFICQQVEPSSVSVVIIFSFNFGQNIFLLKTFFFLKYE